MVEHKVTKPYTVRTNTQTRQNNPQFKESEVFFPVKSLITRVLSNYDFILSEYPVACNGDVMTVGMAMLPIV